MRLIAEKSALPKWHKRLVNAAEKHDVDLTCGNCDLEKALAKRMVQFIAMMMMIIMKKM